MSIDIFNELQKYALHYSPIIKGDSAWIRCPFHKNGEEKTPSCRINLQKNKYPIGYFYCYGCGKYGLWNDLADAIHGLTKLSEADKKEQELFIKRLTQGQIDSLYGLMPKIDFSSMIPWDKSDNWRSITGKLLYDLGAKKCLEYNNDEQLFLPCNQNSVLKGGIYCRLKKEQGKSSYIYTSGEWVKKTFFPYDLVKKMYKNKDCILALVEGPRDALNLIQNGFPALAILGSHNWCSLKAKLISSLSPKKIVLAFDNDEAGKSANNLVSKSFKDYNNILKIDFGDKNDPGELTSIEIKNLFKKIQML